MRPMSSGLTAASPAIMGVGNRRWWLLAPATTSDKEGMATSTTTAAPKRGEAAGRVLTVSPQVPTYGPEAP